jgi:hypothetical protein
MLVPYLGNLTSSREDLMNGITDSEYEKMKEFESVRESSLRALYASIGRDEASIVLDDFLFLGSMRQAGNRELLERYQISKIFQINFDLYSSLRTYFKCL